ncbi:blastula protease 10-like [Gigantopelta aegis]|uniref:blastula protease 10-like n=1 Tax=Gigantopelta aegis TaxID=1735272 RepID=UPI001B88E742|nr:blastula protease 10-like [Gigantopelta aegis]
MTLQPADPLAVLQTTSSRGLPRPAEERNIHSGAVELDMVLTPYQRFFRESDARSPHPSTSWKRKALADGTRHWPQAIIPFELDAGLDAFHLKWAMDAMMQWQLKTCIRFQQRNLALSRKLGHSDFIRFTAGTDCKTAVGKISGGQTVSIGSCNKGSIIHELGHTIGYVHEQSRPDRDDNVRIIIPNIKPANVKEFGKFSNNLVTTFGTPYDYSSIMHYSSTAFSKSDNPLLITVQTNDPHVQMVIGQRSLLTDRNL